jgi:ATP-dependent exoDNAse (exonuclease V) beta subunit
MQGSDNYEYIAVIIKKCIEDGFLIADENAGFREIQYRDFLILSWSTYGMEKLYQCLEDNGIPVDIAGKIYVNESRTMNAFVRLYKAVACSGGRNSHSYQGMYDIMDNKLHKTVASAKDYTQEMDYVNESILQLRKKTYGMDAYALARYLAEHMEYYLGKDGEGRLKLISVQKKIEQMIMSAMQEKCMGRQDLVKYFEAYLNKFVEREISLKNDSDTVRFMNVHKAKGLEGNIVIILPGSKSIWDKESAYRKKTDKGDYDCYEVIKNNTGFNSKDYVSYKNKPDIEKEAKEEANKEVVRLEYVATTRAKEALIIAGVELGSKASTENDEDAHNLPPLAEMQYKDCKDLVAAMGIAEAINKKTQESFEAKNESNKNVRKYSGESCSIDTTEEMSAPQLLDITPSALETSASFDKKETDGNKEIRPKGNIFGNIMHRSFELLVNVYRRSKDWDVAKKSIEVCVNRALMENCDDMDMIHAKEGGFDGKKVEYRDYLVEKLNEFIEDSDVRAILEEPGTKIYTELAFSYMMTENSNPEFFEAMKKHFEKKKISIASQEQPVWIHGFSDLVLYNEKTGEIRILDYKSDRKGNADYDVFIGALREKYMGQLDLYDKSMQRIFGVKSEAKLKTTYNLYQK